MWLYSYLCLCPGKDKLSHSVVGLVLVPRCHFLLTPFMGTEPHWSSDPIDILDFRVASTANTCKRALPNACRGNRSPPAMLREHMQQTKGGHPGACLSWLWDGLLRKHSQPTMTNTHKYYLYSYSTITVSTPGPTHYLHHNFMSAQCGITTKGLLACWTKLYLKSSQFYEFFALHLQLSSN